MEFYQNQPYRILATLRQGAGHTSYLAEEVATGRHVALKHIHRRCGSGVYRVAPEHVLRRLRHRALAPVEAVWEQQADIFMVQTLVSGVTLEQWLQQNPVTEERMLQWASEICDILQYLHQVGSGLSFSGELTPSGIGITGQGSVVLMDYGITWQYDPEEPHHADSAELTGFRGPEQFCVGQCDSRTDIYSLGAICYMLFTGIRPGIPPYRAVPMAQLKGPWGSATARCIDRAMHPDPDFRFQTVGEMKAVLESLEEDKERERKAWGRALIGRAFALGLALTSLLFMISGLNALFFSSIGSTSVKIKGLFLLLPGMAFGAAAWFGSRFFGSMPVRKYSA